MKIDLKVRPASTISCPIQFGEHSVKNSYLAREGPTLSNYHQLKAEQRPKSNPHGRLLALRRQMGIYFPPDGFARGAPNRCAGIPQRENSQLPAGAAEKRFLGQGFFQSLVRRPINQGKGPRRLIFGRRQVGGGLFSGHVAPALHAGHAANFAKPGVFKCRFITHFCVKLC